MALADDATTRYDSSGYNNSHTFTHTTGSGSDRGMVLAVYCRQMADVTGADYNGDAAAQEVESVNADVCGTRLYSLINPDSGSNTVTVSLGAYRLLSAVSHTVEGANQSDLVEATTSVATGYSVSANGSITSATDGARIYSAANLQNAGSLSTSSNYTSLSNADHSDANLGQGGLFYTTIDVAGESAAYYSWPSNDNYSMCLASVKPSSAVSNSYSSYPIIGGTVSNPSTSAVNYIPVNAEKGATWAAVDTSALFLITRRTYIGNLYVKLANAPGAGKSYAFTLYRKNAYRTAATNVTLTVSDTSTTGSVAVYATVEPGDFVYLAATPSGTPTAPTGTYWHLTAKQDRGVLSYVSTAGISTSVRYTPPTGGKISAASSAVTGADAIVPVAGTISDLGAKLLTSPGTAKSYTFTLYKNGSSTSLTTTISDSSTYGADNSNTVTVAAGDAIAVRSESSGTPTSSDFSTGMTFTPDTPGQFPLFLVASAGPSASAANYGPINTGTGTWSTTESDNYMIVGTSTVKSIYHKVYTAPGTGKSWTATLRVAGSDSALAATISDANTTASASTDVAISEGDYLTIKTTPSGTPSGSMTPPRVSIVYAPASSSNITVTPGTVSLTLTPYAPTVTATGNISVTPATASLAITAYAPTVAVSDNQTITPGTASLALTTFAPTVVATDNKTVTPGTAALTLTTYAPTVVATNNITVTPGTATLSLSSFQPTVAITNNVTVTPGTATLALTGYALTVSVTGNLTVTPGVASLTLTTYAPRVTVGSFLVVGDSATNASWAAGSAPVSGTVSVGDGLQSSTWVPGDVV